MRESAGPASAVTKVLAPFAMLLCLSGMSSCSTDSIVALREVPRVPPAVVFDANALRERAKRAILPGDRILVGQIAGESAVGDNASVDFSSVDVSDTAVVALDVTGMMYARAAGSAWLRWRLSDTADSMRVTVVPESEPTSSEASGIVPSTPSNEVDVRYPRGRTRGETVGRSFMLSQNGDLQAALDAAQPGDEIVLPNGGSYTGNFTLPAKSGSAWIVIRGESPPQAGQRADTANSAATVYTKNVAAAITAAPGSHHWRLVGFNIRLAPVAVHNNGIVRLGQGNEATVAELVSDIILDRMIVSGSTTGGTSRCVALNGARQAIIDSQLLECHEKGSDAQAIAGWGGPGPYLIENNRLEGSGETILFGGADPAIAGMVPSDITIRRNYFTRPLSWAGKWLIKNILELKNAQRVLIEGNVMENNWADGQVGFAILLKALSQDDRAPWSTMQDVTIRNNVVRNSSSGFNIAYKTSAVVKVGTSRVLIANNMFENIGKDPISGIAYEGRVVQLLGEVTDVTLSNNTVTLGGETGQIIGFDGNPAVRLRVVNNVFPASTYGIKGSGTGAGNATLNVFAPGYVLTGNVLPNAVASLYPSNNFFPPSGWGQKLSKDWQSACANARDLTNGQGIPDSVGANCTTVMDAVQGVVKDP